MRTPPRLAIGLVLCLLSGLLLVAAAPAPAERLGPGSPPQPGFSGYTTRAGHELGVARLSTGATGICLDTGTRSWPRSPGRAVPITDPVVGYLLSVHLERARRDGVLAAALWWAVGKVRGLNSQPGRMRAHLADLGRESPALHRQVRRRAHDLLVDARRHAAPRQGYGPGQPTLRSSGVTGTVAGLGLRSAADRWVPGVVAQVTLRGARFRDGRTTRTLKTSTRPRSLAWRRTSGSPVSVRVRYTRVPHHRYLLHRGDTRYQRVAVSAGLRTLSARARIRGLASPTITTLVNLQQAHVGATLVDAVTVHGTRGATLTGEWQLLGPVAPGGTRCRDLDWQGAPIAGRGTFRVRGDGTSSVGSTRVEATGCYTYRERLRASATTRAVPWTRAGIVEETSHVQSRPTFRTEVNRRRVVVGGTLVDKVIVEGVPSGPGATALDGQWQLLGPVVPDGDQRCRRARWKDAPVAARGRFTVKRNGVVRVGRTTVRTGGCYTYRERIAPSAHSVEAPWSAAGLVEETALVTPRQPRIPKHPQVATGGSQGAPPAGRADLDRPRLKIFGPHLSAALRDVAFRGSTLRPARHPRVAGLWSAGAGLAALVGTTVIAGHVSDNRDRPGAFHGLRRLRIGEQLRTVDSSGSVRRWRVVQVRTFDRRKLPRSLFAQRVQRKLTLITCTDRVATAGGFHYRKNLVVEAEPW